MNEYKEAMRLHLILKQLSQLSWEINQTDKRFPIEKIDENNLEGLLSVYQVLVTKGYQLLKDLTQDES